MFKFTIGELLVLMLVVSVLCALLRLAEPLWAVGRWPPPTPPTVEPAGG